MIEKCRIYKISFLQMLDQIRRDAMLFVASLAPLLAGLFFCFLVPLAEEFLTSYFNKPSILAPYYLLIDLLLVSIAPLMAGFIGAMVILSEMDDKITKYICVTPLGSNGYLVSRLFLPAFFFMIYSIVLGALFSLTHLSFTDLLLYSFSAAVLGIIIALFIIAIAGNKVEGMALGKLSGFLFAGVIIPFFIRNTFQYIAFFLPSFWLAKYALGHHIYQYLLGLLTNTIWFVILYRRFKRKSF